MRVRYDFACDEFGQTLKAGLQISLDERARWGLSPYVQFPLDHLRAKPIWRTTSESSSASVT